MKGLKKEKARRSVIVEQQPMPNHPLWSEYMKFAGIEQHVSGCKLLNCYMCQVNRSFFQKIWLPNQLTKNV